MRLIDADRIIKRLEEWNTNDAYDKAFYNFTMNRLMEQPTAFNLDKVVEELEEESNFFNGEPMGTLQKTFYCKGIDKAIKIVKRGGVDD